MEIIKRMDGDFFHANRDSRVVGEGPKEEVREVVMENLVDFSIDSFVDHGVGGSGGLFKEAIHFFVFVLNVIAVSSGVKERIDGREFVKVPDMENHIKALLGEDLTIPCGIIDPDEFDVDTDLAHLSLDGEAKLFV